MQYQQHRVRLFALHSHLSAHLHTQTESDRYADGIWTGTTRHLPPGATTSVNGLNNRFLRLLLLLLPLLVRSYWSGVWTSEHIFCTCHQCHQHRTCMDSRLSWMLHVHGIYHMDNIETDKHRFSNGVTRWKNISHTRASSSVCGQVQTHHVHAAQKQQNFVRSKQWKWAESGCGAAHKSQFTVFSSLSLSPSQAPLENRLQDSVRANHIRLNRIWRTCLLNPPRIIRYNTPKHRWFRIAVAEGAL